MADFAAIQRALNKQSKRLDAVVTEALRAGALDWNAERERPDSGSFHISRLGNCLRELYYARFDPIPFEASTLKKFRAGVDTGQRVVDYLRRGKALYGLSYCLACGWHTTEPDVVSVCKNCNGAVGYPEIGIRDVSIGDSLSGKMDALVIGPESRVFVSEIKAASVYYKVDKRQNVEQKLRPHIQQGNMYLGLLRRFRRLLEKGIDPRILFYEDRGGECLDGKLLTQRISLDSFALIYEDKNSMDNFVHEFEYDHEMYLEDRARVKLFFDCVAARKLPPREMSKCRYCDYQERCGKRQEA